MSTDKKINVITISLILLAFMGSMFLPEWKLWFNMIAIAAFGCTLFYQSYQLYKQGKEWKKYTLLYAVLCLVLGVLLFI